MPMFLVVALLGGCGGFRSTDADPNIQGGLQAVSKGQYQKAAAYFELAQTHKDRAAVSRYQQQLTQLILADEKLQQGDLAAATAHLQQLAQETLTRAFQQKYQDLSEALASKKATIATTQQAIATLETLVANRQFTEAQTALEKLLAQDLSAAYYQTDRQKLLAVQQRYFREQQADWQAQKQHEQAAIEAQDDLVPAALQAVWYEKAPTDGNQDNGQPVIKLTGTTLYDYRTDRVYEIIAVQWQENHYTLQWDLNRFAQRYGNQALGADPLPFQFTLEPATAEKNYRTLATTETAYYSN